VSWLYRKPKPETPKQAEPPPQPDFIVGESIIVALKCMKCGDRFEIVMYLHTVQPAPGLCKCCHQVVEWMMPPQAEQYLEFLRMETQATRREWIVRKRS
jgi:hypothetical protein